MQLFSAAHQWATRPADERFNSLEEMFAATKAYADRAGVASVKYNDLRVECDGAGEIRLVGKAGLPARFTHYAFGQLSQRAGAPAGYLRDLPATLAAQNLNHGLRARAGSDEARLLIHRGDSEYVLRAALSPRYERVWNWEVISRLGVFASRNGLVPSQATFSWSDRPAGGDDSGPVQLDPNAEKSLYASDHDMFAFLMTPDRVIMDPVGQPMRRGIIVSNSEVGAASLRITGFLFRDVCINHIIWGAKDLAEVRMPHIGSVRERMAGVWGTVRKYLDGAASLDEALVKRATAFLGKTKEEALDTLFGVRSLRLSRQTLVAAYDAVVREEDGDPRTVWGMAQGITRHSQTIPFADERQELDRAAGRLLELTF